MARYQISLKALLHSVFWCCVGLAAWAVDYKWLVEECFMGAYPSFELGLGLVGLRFVPFFIAVGILIKHSRVMGGIGLALWAAWASLVYVVLTHFSPG